ncbi:polyprenyl synthetase family protein [Brevibacterium aurantiacum]|uniref:Geranylgeranyl diphosphate synthase n=1 Tax=Brevibacterium aurantiacum TaxID=273384 RepID=A0A1D7W512_BREAU|nr:polyprenyl synthetase family protein [Brevibacterium aurantiacum]AOP54064.1 Geranylgeranyl diphosphate synthase [Brevibacterium aurantiacum]RCS98914.1 polyprenyl synthetase family protein [Brevibacterium aurantiacum]
MTPADAPGTGSTETARSTEPSQHGTTVSELDSPESIAAEVSAGIEAFLELKAAEFLAISPDADDIGRALLEFTRGGKMIRPVLLWWGFQLASGDDSSRSALNEGVAEAAGSLELLHAAALIHDDVIDHSDTRRGKPALHRQFESRHSERRFQGGAEPFGVAAAIVIGDICLALSEELFEKSQSVLGITPSARDLRATLRRDVMVGQYLDVLAEVVPLDDARIGERAWEVLSFKSAKYSVEQPLLLGAALGGADEEQLAEISRFGLPLGQAFQLRDDVLGIFGDPAATGKPAGDDIREGKRTVLIAESMKNLNSEQTQIMAERLGDPDLSDSEVAECVSMLTESGGLDAVESFIRSKHDEALSVVREWATDSSPVSSTRTRIGPTAQRQLTKFAEALSYRKS